LAEGMKIQFSSLSRLSFFFFSLFLLAACQNSKPDQTTVYEILDKYFEEKGVEKVDEAIAGIIKKQQEQAPDTIQKRLNQDRVVIDISKSPVRGPADAKVTIVEYSDFHCPFARQMLPAWQAFRKEYEGKVRYVFKHYPLRLRLKVALEAATASIAAQEQGKFWEFYDMAYSIPAIDLTREAILKWAKTSGLDVDKFTKTMDDPASKKRAEDEAKEAKDLQSPGTPTYFFNGVRLSGVQPLQNLQEITNSLLFEVSGE